MKKIVSRLKKLETESFILLGGNIALFILFLALFFGFFNKMIDLPLAVILAAPFVNLNFYLHVKYVDFCLTYNLRRSFGHYILKLATILVPVLISIILYVFDIKIFNPIVVMASFVVFHLVYFVELKRVPSHV